MSNQPGREDAIVDAALDLPLGERETFLQKACGDDPRLRRLVEALLKAHHQVPTSIHDAPELSAPGGTMIVSVQPVEKPGDRIGHYKLLQQVGEGGCGVVYMAEQEEPVRRRVALKVIKMGMDTRQVIARFEAERQALALMDHPNIAKVLDGGSTDAGRPYFVMELVRGVRITDYCDQNNLSTAQRLGLFVQVCKAIQHAHQKGIIHRDIKPSNILVTLHDGIPVPKVIDFGIAKAIEQRLTDKTLFTALEQFMGTPAYMSPEQAEMSGLDIDTRSDIYSLGVLLYELLTGQMPFDPAELRMAGLDEMRRIIREKEPVKPSTRLSSLAAAEQTTVAKRRQVEAPRLLHLVRGDLDWIVMKSMEKDRTRRYETANGLASDIQRHLNSEPVLASPPSAAYRFGKLVRRNRLAFTAMTAVAAALAVGLALAAWQYFEKSNALNRTLAAEKQARTEAAKSQQVAQFFKAMLEGVGPSVALGRDTLMLREILDKTSESLSRDLPNQPEVEADLRNTIGEVYLLLGEFGKAETMHRKALALLRKQPKIESLEVARSLDNLAVALAREGKLPQAETTQREGLALRRKLQGVANPDLAVPLTTLAGILSDQGNLPEAESTQREALALRKKRPDAPQEIADALKGLASVLFRDKQLPEAEALDREALALQRKALRPEDPEIAMTLNDLGTVLHLQGNFPESEASFREAVAVAGKSLDKDHPALLTLRANLATALGDQGKFVEAEQSQRELLALRTNRLGAVHPRVADSLSNLARVLQAEGKLREAETSERAALAMRQKLFGGENIDVAVSLNHLGNILKDQGRLEEAETTLRQTLAMRKKLLGTLHRDVAWSLHDLAEVLFERGYFQEAETNARECLGIQEKIIPDDWRTPLTASLLGGVLLQEKKFNESETWLHSAYDGLRQREAMIPAQRKNPLAETLQRLTQFYQVTGQSNQAAEWTKKLDDFEKTERAKKLNVP
jgi:serine/threonine protein kinase/tetratricopeptide (TPR) repeat protein